MVVFRILLVVFLSYGGVFSLKAQSEGGPLISITSPEQATTFAYGNLKSNRLYWDKGRGVLLARVTYTNENYTLNTDKTDDVHDFSLPGIYFDDKKLVFWTKSYKGDIVPIAVQKKKLFFNTIEILPNARIRLIRDRSNLSVVLEAIRPDDPALTQNGVKEGTHPVNFNQIHN